MCLISHLWAGTDSEPLVRQDMTAPGGEEYQYQDRRQEIVFIGHRMKRKVIQELLDSCLLTEEEMALGPDKWKETMEDEESIVLELDDGAGFLSFSEFLSTEFLAWLTRSPELDFSFLPAASSFST